MTPLLRKSLFAAIAVLGVALVPFNADARVVGGTRFPEEVRIGGRELVLNGAAVQKVLVFKVYAVGLYLENPTENPQEALAADNAKRIHLRVLRNASSDQIVGALRDGIEKSGADMAALESRLEQVNEAIPDVKKGEVLYITYLPGLGTELRGRTTRVVIKGADFAKALFSTWLGADPGVEKIRDELLGA